MELELKDEMFINEYLTNGYNATKAYIATHPAVTYDTARCNAYKTKRRLQPEIDKRMEDVIGEKEEIAQKILLQLQNMAFSPKDDEVYNPSVKLKAQELLQKQLGLQTQNNNIKVEAVIFEGDGELED